MTGNNPDVLESATAYAGVAQQLILARLSELLGAESPLLGMTVTLI